MSEIFYRERSRSERWLFALVILFFAGAVCVVGHIGIRCPGVCQVVCMGDSITYGSGVKETRDKDSYPAQLQELLGGHYRVVNYGVGGKTLQDTADKPYRATGYIERTIENCPDIIVLMLGTNDTRPNNWEEEEYVRQYGELLRRLRAIQNGPEICIMIPPKAFPNREGRVIYRIDNEIISGRLRKLIPEIAKENHVSCIDLYSLTEKHPEYFADGVHPNKLGNRMIAQEVAERIRQFFS